MKGLAYEQQQFGGSLRCGLFNSVTTRNKTWSMLPRDLPCGVYIILEYFLTALQKPFYIEIDLLGPSS